MFPEFEKYSLYSKSKGTITSSNTIVMKTAMQEMLLNIEALEAITTDQEQIYMLTHLKVGALLIFKKEKEQIESYELIIEELRKAHTKMQKEISLLKNATRPLK